VTARVAPQSRLAASPTRFFRSSCDILSVTTLSGESSATVTTGAVWATRSLISGVRSDRFWLRWPIGEPDSGVVASGRLATAEHRGAVRRTQCRIRHTGLRPVLEHAHPVSPTSAEYGPEGAPHFGYSGVTHRAQRLPPRQDRCVSGRFSTDRSSSARRRAARAGRHRIQRAGSIGDRPWLVASGQPVEILPRRQHGDL